MWTVHILWFPYRLFFSLKPRSDALISTRVYSVRGDVTPLYEVYTNVRLEGVYFYGLQVYEWVCFSLQKYINGVSFLLKKYMNM